MSYLQFLRKLIWRVVTNSKSEEVTMKTLIVRTVSEAHKNQLIREGRGECRRVGCHRWVNFRRIPPALDKLVRDSYFLCGHCYQKYLANGKCHRTKIIKFRPR